MKRTRKVADDKSEKGQLRIDDELVMLEVGRGERDQLRLRLTLTKGTKPDGEKTEWLSIREFYKDPSGALRPSSRGISIRRKEIAAVADALVRATRIHA